MERAQKATYGDGLDERYLQKFMWTWKPHYYSPGLSFYNFPYAFGLLFATGLYAIYQQRGPAFVEDYKNLLASTGEATAGQPGQALRHRHPHASILGRQPGHHRQAGRPVLQRSSGERPRALRACSLGELLHIHGKHRTSDTREETLITEQQFSDLRRRVTHLEGQVAFLYSHLGMTFEPEPQLDDDPRIIEALKSGNLLQAMKIYRENTGDGDDARGR